MAMTEKYIHYIFTTAEQSKRKQKNLNLLLSWKQLTSVFWSIHNFIRDHKRRHDAVNMGQVKV